MSFALVGSLHTLAPKHRNLVRLLVMNRIRHHCELIFCQNRFEKKLNRDYKEVLQLGLNPELFPCTRRIAPKATEPLKLAEIPTFKTCI